jgi:cytosine/adenosine deaminase-related metal-dependent hydrolase
MSTIILKNATAVVTLDDEDSVLYNADILIRNNVIAETGTCSCPDADKVIDASGCYVYPGLINTHHHLYQTFTRNLPLGIDGEPVTRKANELARALLSRSNIDN